MIEPGCPAFGIGVTTVYRNESYRYVEDRPLLIGRHEHRTAPSSSTEWRGRFGHEKTPRIAFPQRSTRSST
jgi:hypothetical protein